MSIQYECIPASDAHRVRELCNALMAYQKSKATIHPEWFDTMSFETRLLPSMEKASANHLLIATKDEEVIGYAYSNISPKATYAGGFATLAPVRFFDFDSVKTDDVGCLSQFYLKDEYRGSGVGTALFDRSIEWLRSADSIRDIFIFVSNGNEGALRFYLKKGFSISHQILDGFITVLRNFD